MKSRYYYLQSTDEGIKSEKDVTELGHGHIAGRQQSRESEDLDQAIWLESVLLIKHHVVALLLALIKKIHNDQINKENYYDFSNAQLNQYL